MRTTLARESLESKLEQLGDRLEALLVEESELVSTIRGLESNQLDIGAVAEAVKAFVKRWFDRVRNSAWPWCGCWWRG